MQANDDRATNKKPVGSVPAPEHPLLRAHINNLSKQLHQLDQERDQLQNKIREWTRKLRQHGWSSSGWVAIAFAGIVCLIYAVLICFPRTEWRVLEQTDPAGYEWILQRVIYGRALLPELRRICPGELRPYFENGMTLTSFRFDEKGACISLAAYSPAYRIRRDKN